MKTATKLFKARQILDSKDTAYMCRLMSGDKGNRPVYVVEGGASPHMTGEGYHAESRTGIKASMAALKRFWSTYHYVASTRATEVGADWLLNRRNRVERRTDDGVEMLVLPGHAICVGKVRLIPGWIKGERKVIAVRGKRSYHMARGRLKDMDATALVKQATDAWAKQDEHKKTDRFFMRDLKTTRVTLHDSRRAGNCVEGSLQFAERKLKLTRQEVLAAGHLLNISASRILAVANGQTAPARRACMAAWLRETTISI